MGKPNRTQSSKPLPGGSRRPGAMEKPTRTQSSKPLPGGSRRPGAMGIPESGKGLPQSKGAARYKHLAALSGSRRPWDCCDSSQLCGRPRRFRRNPLRTHAFTLVELLVVVAIIAIIAALGIPAFNRAMAGARTSGCMSDLRQVHAAMMAYASDHDGRLPMPWNGRDEIFWERALARPSDGGVYLPPESIHPGGNRKGNIRRLLFNREVAAMGGDPRGQDPNFTRSNYQMNHEFNLSFPNMRPQEPETMHRLAAFEWPNKTMVLMSGWALGYRTPHQRGHRGNLEWERGPAFIHNGDKAIVLYAAGNIGLLTKEEVPTDPATKEWREFWLPTLNASEWK